MSIESAIYARKSIEEYNAEWLDRLSEAIFPRHEGDVDEKELVDSIERCIKLLMSTADFAAGLEMVTFTMIQGLCDMAYNKGCGVLDRLQQLHKQLQNLAPEADGTEFYEEKIEKLKWKQRQLEAQHFYWQRFWKAARKVYVRTVMLMKSEGTYTDLPDDWLPPQERYAKYHQHKRLVQIRNSQTIGKALAEHGVR